MLPFNQQIAQILDRNRAVLIQRMNTQHDRTPSDPIPLMQHEYRENLQIGTKSFVDNLTQAVAADSPALFADYVSWARETMTSRQISTDQLANGLERMDRALEPVLPVQFKPLVSRYISAGAAQLPKASSVSPTCLRKDEPLAGMAETYLEMLLRGQRIQACQFILDAVRDNLPVQAIYLHVFQTTQQEIGRLWQLNQLSVAQEHYCTAATQAIMSQLYPYIFTDEQNGRTLVATCVSTELHEIGLRMVADFFEMGGWDTYYIGANAPAEDVVRTLIERNADLLAVSASMTVHIGEVTRIISAVRSESACRNVSIMVGGYPFNIELDLWRTLGADGCARNAQTALAVAESMVRE